MAYSLSASSIETAYKWNYTCSYGIAWDGRRMAYEWKATKTKTKKKEAKHEP